MQSRGGGGGGGGGGFDGVLSHGDIIAMIALCFYLHSRERCVTKINDV